MRIGLDRAGVRWLFLAVVLTFAGVLFFLAGKVWLAAYWDASSKPQLWEMAAKLEPKNAGYWLHLGLYYEQDLDHGNLRQAVSDFEKAARANPRSDEIWLNTASAYEILGEPRAARRAYERAQASYPISPVVAWRYGSFLVRQSDYPEACAEIRRAILTDPSLTTGAIAQLWEANQGISTILDSALPARKGYYFTALSFFLSQHQTDPALAVWDRLLKLKQPFQMRQAIPLVEALIQESHLDEAEQTWSQALHATTWPVDADANGSLVFNGGFEHPLLNGGFDWREIAVDGATYAFNRNVVHSGQRSLRVRFSGTANLDFANLQQYVRVEPSQHYNFSAYLRTEGITTDSGMRFEIYDSKRPAALTLLTPNLVGTNPWTRVNTSFVTGADTNLLVIALRRIPSQKFDNKLRGTVWVDDVSLMPMKSKTKDRQ